MSKTENHTHILKWAIDYLMSEGYSLQGLPAIVVGTPWSTVMRFSTSKGFPIYRRQLCEMMKYLSLIFLLFFSFQTFAGPIKIFAHRGGAFEFPENTLYAFQRVIEAGVDGIELDVQLTKDNIVVVYHPRDLSKNTNGKGHINEYNYKEIKSLDAGFNYDPLKNESYPERNKGHYIPSLDEIFKHFSNSVIIIDFKSIPEKPLVDSVIKVINKYNAWGNIIFYSTDPKHIDYLLEKAPLAKAFENRHVTLKRLLTLRNSNVCCCETASQYIGFELSKEMSVEEHFELGADKQAILFDLWDHDVVECTRKNIKDQQIFIFNINTESDYNKVKELNVDAVFTNAPLKLLKLKKIDSRI